MSVIGSIITSHLGETFQVDKITPTRIQASLSDALEAIEHPKRGADYPLFVYVEGHILKKNGQPGTRRTRGQVPFETLTREDRDAAVRSIQSQIAFLQHRIDDLRGDSEEFSMSPEDGAAKARERWGETAQRMLDAVLRGMPPKEEA